MAYRYYIDQESNCVFIRHFGEYTLGEGFEVFQEILGDPQHQPNMNVYRELYQAHFSEALKDAYATGVIRDRLKNIDPRIGKARIAWVVSTAADFAVAHRWTVSARAAGGIERQVFRDVSRAKVWLGIPENYEITFPEMN